MSVAALALLVHGDDTRLDLVYFWAAVLIALTPVLIFGGMGVWVLRAIWRARRAGQVPPEQAPSVPPPG
jgi:hypothetical protein